MEKLVLEFSWQMEHAQLIKSRDNYLLEVFNSHPCSNKDPLATTTRAPPLDTLGKNYTNKEALKSFPYTYTRPPCHPRKNRHRSCPGDSTAISRSIVKSALIISDPCSTLVCVRTGVQWHYLPLSNVSLYLSAR